MYADDTTLSCNLNNMNKENARLLLNAELKHVSDWLACNTLSLNIDKTKYMVFYRKRKQKIVNPSISMNNVTIERVHNFLGLEHNFRKILCILNLLSAAF